MDMSLRSKVKIIYLDTQKSLCKSIVKHPVRHCLFHWFILLTIAGIVLGNNWFDFIEININDFIVHDTEDTRNFFAIGVADALREQDIDISPRSQDLFGLSFQFLYEVDDGDLLTADIVKEICEVERIVFDNALYTRYCLTEDAQGENTVCVPESLSVSFNFYGNEGDCFDLTTEEFDALRANISQGDLAFMLDDVNSPTVLRTLIPLAGPLGIDSPPNKEFNDVPGEDFNDEQVFGGYQIIFDEVIRDLFTFYGVEDKPLSPGFFRNFFTREESPLKTRTGGAFIDSFRFDIIIQTDQVISGGTYLVVLLFMTMYMRTFFLSAVSMLAIAISLLVGLFLYRGIFQINYFTPMNILIMFLIGGVGADNVFVLFDAWRQSYHEFKHLLSEESEKTSLKKDISDEGIPLMTDSEKYMEYLSERLNYAYGRAAFSVSQTAGTTILAFLATMNSEISVIAALGLYGALVIFTNFWYMFTVHPSNLMFFHYIFVLKRKYSMTKRESSVVNLDQTEFEVEAYQPMSTKRQGRLNSLLSCSFIDKGLQIYIHLINETIMAKVSLIFVSIVITVLVSSTFRLTTPSVIESNYPPGHMLEAFRGDYSDLFSSGTPDAFTLVEGVFGIQEFDLTASKFETVNLGNVIFDDNFEIFSQESQNFILQICEELPTIPCFEAGCLEPTLVLQQFGVLCVVDAFSQFVKTDQSFNYSFVNPDVDGAFQSKDQFIEKLEEFLESEAGERFIPTVGLIDGSLKYIKLLYRMSMLKFQPLSTKDPVVRVFNDYTEDVVSRAPLQLSSFLQNSFDHFYRHTEVELVEGLFIGLAISLVASFFVLLAGTGNPRVALFAVLGVGSVVGAVLGSIRYLGFELGTAESIAGVFVIGLSIDYIVHLAHLFMYSRHFLEGEENPNKGKEGVFHYVFGQKGDVAYRNKEMLRFSIEKIGPTVLAGALTTFAAAAFLSVCTFAFFKKMSVLLMFTILYSVLFAFFLFLPLLREFGPGLR